MIRVNPKKMFVRDGDTDNFTPLIVLIGGEVKAIQDWLDAHPEATTTILDGSITMDKFHDILKLYTVKDYVTPEMYGAVGDGVADDTAAIQKMFDIAEANCYKFIGRYKTASIQISGRNNVKIIGDGEILGLNAVFRFSSCDDLLIANMHGTRFSIEVVESVNTQIVNNTLTGKESIYDGIKLLNCTNYTIRGNVVSGFGVDGIKVSNVDDDNVTTKSQDGIIADNFIFGNTDGGIDLYAGGKNVVVSGNFIANNRAGMTLKYTGTNATNEGYSKDILITGNFIHDCDVLISIDMSNVFISGNIFKNPVNHGILIGYIEAEYTYDDIMIDGNSFVHENADNKVSAVTAFKTKSISFSNNNVRGYYCGITTSATDNKIASNDFKNVATPIQFNPDYNYKCGMTVMGCAFFGVTDKVFNFIGVTNFEKVILAHNVWDGYSGIVYDTNKGYALYNQTGNSWNVTTGETADRPKVGQYSVPTQVYYDITLGKPIWRNHENNAWIDATGATV